MAQNSIHCGCSFTTNRQFANLVFFIYTHNSRNTNSHHRSYHFQFSWDSFTSTYYQKWASLCQELQFQSTTRGVFISCRELQLCQKATWLYMLDRLKRRDFWSLLHIWAILHSITCWVKLKRSLDMIIQWVALLSLVQKKFSSAIWLETVRLKTLFLALIKGRSAIAIDAC